MNRSQTCMNVEIGTGPRNSFCGYNVNGIFVAECPMSHIYGPCLLSAVPMQSNVSVPCIPSSVSRLCSLSPVLCNLSQVICSLSPILLSPSQNHYQQSQCFLSVALCHCFCPLFLCFPSSVPPSLVLCPLSFMLQECELFLKIDMHCILKSAILMTG
jgi:hypothetical protein